MGEEGRDEVAKRLREGAKSMALQRDFAGLADLVELMADSVGDEDEDRGLLTLIQEFTSPAVASAIVARLAAADDEGERARLVRVLSRVGTEGAMALTDALEQGKDRSERRTFLRSMVGLGPMGFEMAKRMVEDPRWYVVRNGVAVLGELGGRDAVTYLTSTLASGDKRVRKETIRALARIGGTDAESLLLGMLDDGEPDVRAVACRALGVLGSVRAVRPLQELLDDDDQDVQVECIQALGHIGDPGPVQSIERKAFGGFFSRPPREVRIAAFRALAAIGTPRASKALQKGAEDWDAKVKASVLSLLGAT
jgi:HEAT repeat protein